MMLVAEQMEELYKIYYHSITC